MTSELKVENLDHLGLIAGVIDELELVEQLNELFPPHRDNQITTGQVVKAMILNCLGFLSAPLYLFSQFFESKPVAGVQGLFGQKTTLRLYPFHSMGFKR